MTSAAPVQMLIVDDEPNIRRALLRVLRAEGLSLHFADSGEAALRIVCANAIDIVMSDNLMPGMKGVELLARVREQRPCTVRILLTAVADRDTALRAINESHVEHLLEKPWDDGALRALIRDIAATVRMRRTLLATPDPAAAVRTFAPRPRILLGTS